MELNNLFYEFYEHFAGFSFYNLMNCLNENRDNVVTKKFYEIKNKRDKILIAMAEHKRNSLENTL